jgi:hypothetical protein
MEERKNKKIEKRARKIQKDIIGTKRKNETNKQTNKQGKNDGMKRARNKGETKLKRDTLCTQFIMNAYGPSGNRTSVRLHVSPRKPPNAFLGNFIQRAFPH